MSDNENTTQDCCVCLEPAQTIAATPCNHSDPLCETCFLKIICEAYLQRYHLSQDVPIKF